MPVLAKFRGIVIRMLIDRTFGKRLHAFYGDSELVVALDPVRVIQGDVPAWVEDQVLQWARQYQRRILPAWALDPSFARSHPVAFAPRAG